MLAKCFPKVSLQSHLSWKSYGMDECAWNKCRNSTTEFNLFNWCDVAECAVWTGCCNLFHSFCLCNFIGWCPMSEYTISWYSKKLTYKEKLCYFNFFRSLACKNLSFSVWFFGDLVVEVSQKFLFCAGYCRDPCIILCYASHLSMLSHALLTKIMTGIFSWTLKYYCVRFAGTYWGAAVLLLHRYQLSHVSLMFDIWERNKHF